MNDHVSENTKAILLLTAHMRLGRVEPAMRQGTSPLSNAEYQKVARALHALGRQPQDLLDSDSAALLANLAPDLSVERIQSLLRRGVLLGQALQQWSAREIAVISRADDSYPLRFRQRLKDKAPPILFVAGDPSLLDSGGLAVVGSRNASPELLAFADSSGRAAASYNHTVVSGGARGVDQTAMSGALNAGGKAVGVLADGLDRAVLQHEHQRNLADGTLVLLSPYDPAAGFDVGNAMARNKLIYALADAGLVVSCEYRKGGTWSGAVEQLDSLRYVPIYVRRPSPDDKGLVELVRKSAQTLPDNGDLADTIHGVLTENWVRFESPTLFDSLERNDSSPDLPSSVNSGHSVEVPPSAESAHAAEPDAETQPARRLEQVVRQLILKSTEQPKTDADIANELDVSRPQAKIWLDRLAGAGLLAKHGRPSRYHNSSNVISAGERSEKTSAASIKRGTRSKQTALFREENSPKVP